LKLIDKHELGLKFLEEFKQKVIRHNEDLKEKLAVLTLHKGGMLKQMNSVLSNWKMEAKILYKTVFIRISAGNFIKTYKLAFSFVEDESSFDIVFEKREGVNTGEMIDDFIRLYGDKDIWRVVETGAEHKGLLKLYKKYMSQLKEAIGQANLSLNYGESQDMYKEVEAYISMKLHGKFFMKSPSNRDKEFLKRTISLNWVKPSQLEIDEQLFEYDFWQSAAQSNSFYLLLRVKRYGDM